MSTPYETFRTAMAARWDEIISYGAFEQYGQPALLYGYNEANLIRNLDAVVAGKGRIVHHAGDWPGPQASAGELSGNPMQAHASGRNVATYWSMFTVHCHGYDPAYPDPSVPGVAARHEDAAYLLMQAYLGALAYVAPANGWYRRETKPEWVRDPEQRRFGELLRFQISLLWGVRRAPIYPTVYLTPKPTGIVETPNGDVTIVPGDA